MGFRPLSVYGPGRDVGLTADPTLAMKAAVRGRKFQIRWGGSTDLIYVEDVALGRAWPGAEGLITHVEQPMPFPAALDDTRFQKDLGPAPATSLDAGVRKTLDAFARLQREGRLDTRELT